MYSSPLWRTDTIVVSKLNKSPPSNGLEINMPPSREGGGGWLNRGFMVCGMF